MNDVLSHEEAMRLIALAQQGDQDAQEQLVRCNVALVKSIVKKYLGRGVEFDDLFQVGCVGLVKAIRNFSLCYDVRFSTYAVPMIAGEIKRYLRDYGMIKVSRSLKELAYKSLSAQEQYKRTHGSDPPIQTLAELVGVSVEDLMQAQDALRSCISLSEPIFEDDSLMLLDTLCVTQDSELLLDKLMLKELIGALAPRERKIIILRYFQDKTQSEIAKVLGVSQVQISRLESKIISKLREAMGG